MKNASLSYSMVRERKFFLVENADLWIYPRFRGVVIVKKEEENK